MPGITQLIYVHTFYVSSLDLAKNSLCFSNAGDTLPENHIGTPLFSLELDGDNVFSYVDTHHRLLASLIQLST